MAYFALVDPDYPDWLTYKMLREMREIYDDFNEKNDIDIMRKNGE